MKTAVITGICGQDGPYLAKILLGRGYRVIGVTRQSTHTNFENLQYLQILEQVEIREIDISDSLAITNLIREVSPDEYYNLAAQSFVGSSWELASITTTTNGNAVVYALEAIKNFCPQCRFYQASTSELFGNASDSPQNELTPLQPESPYAASKLYSYWITRIYRESFGLHASNGILFNHESPIRGKSFVTRKITSGIAAIAAGKKDTLELGNLEAKRDWGFAGDFADAMVRIVSSEQPEDFVIATGQSHSIREFLDAAFETIGVQNWEPFVSVNPKYYRPAEVHHLLGDSTKAMRKLKWAPTTSFKSLVQMMMSRDLELEGLSVRPLIKRIA